MIGIVMFFAALAMLSIGYPVAFTFGSQKGWGLGQFDAECAYLQSEGLDISLLLRMPNPAPPENNQEKWLQPLGPFTGPKMLEESGITILEGTLENTE